MSILEPLQITNTHVAAEVLHLSGYGLIWDIVKRFLNTTLPINGQVLLFLRPPDLRHCVLDVLLLPGNILRCEVVAQQEDAKYIKISSNCLLNVGHSYSVHCEPEGFLIQPESYQFQSKIDKNYHTTFEVFLTTNTERVMLMVQDQEGRQVWKRTVHLTGYFPDSRRGSLPEKVEENVQVEDSVPAQERLLSVRTEFINRVSDPALNQLLDKLLHRGIINDEEMQSARIKVQAEKARDIIDTVRKKGTRASSVLIAALCEVDPCISTELNLS
ncbi:baculoviral IAP repeat-containing protein 3 [Dicentrarchus labrax]|uniref:baculoviral IAP repeat-containing protein 3 n=1 Tax=Dicentrarchus labrax TaxID=13489 RepID=UPI0021F615C3|nr:baculoviral IAP repeat-containing protein 3 [Dicentrarchus labrax]